MDMIPAIWVTVDSVSQFKFSKLCCSLVIKIQTIYAELWLLQMLCDGPRSMMIRMFNKFLAQKGQNLEDEAVRGFQLLKRTIQVLISFQETI